MRPRDGRAATRTPERTGRDRARTRLRSAGLRGPGRHRRRPSNDAATIAAGRRARFGLRRDTLQRWLLVPADALAAGLAVTLAISVLGEENSLGLAVLATLPLIVLASKIMGLYDRDQHLLHKTTLDEAPALFQLATLYTLLLWLSHPLLVEGFLGRDQVLGLWGLLFVLLLVGRAAARQVARAAAGPERCLVIGHASSAERVRKKIESSPSMSATIVGRVPLDNESPNGHGPAVVADMSSLTTALVENDIERAIVAPGASSSEETLQAIRLVRSLGVNVSVVPRLFEVVGSSVEFDDLEGILLLGVRREGLGGIFEVPEARRGPCRRRTGPAGARAVVRRHQPCRQARLARARRSSGRSASAARAESSRWSSSGRWSKGPTSRRQSCRS